jgi:hypothetical protein
MPPGIVSAGRRMGIDVGAACGSVSLAGVTIHERDPVYSLLRAERRRISPQCRLTPRTSAPCSHNRRRVRLVYQLCRFDDAPGIRGQQEPAWSVVVIGSESR